MQNLCRFSTTSVSVPTNSTSFDPARSIWSLLLTTFKSHSPSLVSLFSNELWNNSNHHDTQQEEDYPPLQGPYQQDDCTKASLHEPRLSSGTARAQKHVSQAPTAQASNVSSSSRRVSRSFACRLVSIPPYGSSSRTGRQRCCREVTIQLHVEFQNGIL